MSHDDVKALVPFRGGRVHLAARTLLHDPLRLLISLGGIGFAILLVLLLRGIMDGTVSRSTTYIDHVGADVFVARAGVTNMLLATSSIPESNVPQIASAEGVERAAGIMRYPVIVSAGRENLPATAIGHAEDGFGGPWKLKSGRLTENSREAVIDADLADDLGVGLGGAIEIGGEAFTVVGISRETTAIAGKLVFLRKEVIQGLTGASGTVNFVLLKLGPGYEPESVAARLNASNQGLNAMTRSQLSHSDRDMLGSLFLSPINVMSTAGFLVGLAIVGLTMYTTTAERLRDFGVLKAIGASNGYLLRTVMSEAAVLGLGGYALGFIAASVAGPLITRVVPDIGVAITWANALRALIAVMAMSLLSAVVPVARIMRVDPLLVFRRS